MASENPGASPAASLVTAWPEDWCQDWYICSGEGCIEGPLAAEEVFDQPGTSRRSVARRGFAQWYDEEDFAGLWKASRYLRALPVEAVQPGAFGAAEVTGPWATQPSHVAEPDFDIVGALAATGVSLSALTAPVAGASETSLAQADPATQVLVVNEETGLIAPRGERVSSLEGRSLQPRHVWLSQRAQARLGDLRNPVLAATMVTMTFGVYYTAWLLSCLREVVWHMDHDTLVHRRVERPWLAWIPGGHFVVTWELAQLIRTMEEQDGYTSTKPWLAAVLAAFPPLAAGYLQHALNDHWLIHCLGGCQKTPSLADAE